MVCVHPHPPTNDGLPRFFPVGCPTMFRKLHDNNSEERAPTRRDVRREGVPGRKGWSWHGPKLGTAKEQICFEDVRGNHGNQ